MRLLDVNDLSFFEVLSGEPPQYAILSHRWMDGEVLFQEFSTDAAKRKAGYEKIKNCAQKAQEHGIRYIWVDTCCIDKSSSSELSEAINSMALWYAKATVCYAYLADVISPENWNNEDAETILENYGKATGSKGDWQLISSKKQISIPISAITGIDAKLLSAEHPEKELRCLSVAKRMSWAAERITARPEDVAYCLIGLFGVNMPLLYGEGYLGAFRRLQEVIKRVSDDHSILAWMDLEIDPSDGRDGKSSFGPLAKSPIQFKYSGSVVPVPTGLGFPSFSINTRGLSINLQIDRQRVPEHPNICVAWLDCAKKGDPNRVGVCLQYVPSLGTYIIIRRWYSVSGPAPFHAARGTISLDNLATYSTIFKTSGPSTFALRFEGDSQLHGFKSQAAFPDAGWIPKVQTIIPFETSPDDWRCGVTYVRSQPERSEFAIIAGIIDSDQTPLVWCVLSQWNSNIDDLAALVRNTVPRRFDMHQSRIISGEEVVILELGDRKFSNVGDGEFEIRLRIEHRTNPS